MPVNSFEHYYMSWKPERKNLSRPVYLSLANQLEQDIRSGRLAPGTKLPPQRELADYLDLNFTTITRTYKLCEMKGLIYAVTGKGTFVSSYEEQPATLSAEYDRPFVLDFAFVSVFDQCNDMISATARNVAESKHFPFLLDYKHPTGLPHQKQAALNWMLNFGAVADPEHLFIVSGVQNGLMIWLMTFFSAGDKIAVDQFTYTNFIELAKLCHLQLVPIPGDSHGMLPEALDFQCKKKNIRGIFLMPTCCNPTAVIMPESRKDAIAEVIIKHRLFLLEDDNFVFLTAGILPEYERPLYMRLTEHFVYLCGTSKAICSGLRIAYLVSSSDLKERLYQSIFNINVKTSSLDAEIITQLLLNGTAARITSEKKMLAEQCNILFSQHFPEYNSGHPLSFYRWIPIKSKDSGISVERAFQKEGVRVYHSDRFLVGHAPRQSYLRIALTGTRSLKDLDIGLGILKTCIGE